MSIKIFPSVPPVKPPSAADAAKEIGTSISQFEEAFRSALGTSASPAELAAAMRLRFLRQAIDLGEGDAATSAAVSPARHLFDFLPPIFSTGSGPERQSFDSPPVPPAPSVPESSDRSSLPPSVGKSSPPLADLVERAAARHQIAPEVIRAVIRAESGFDAAAVSPAGAQGLMQLMPGTARELGVTDPFDPEQNIMAGTRYLKQMLGRYGGDLEKALAAYNWGPGNLDRSNGRLPEETRRYVARIKGYLESSG